MRLLPFAILSYFLAYIAAMGFYGSKGPFVLGDAADVPDRHGGGAAPSRGSTRSAIWAASSVPGMSG